ncbi:MAG TPA: hypothetical protein VKX49_13115 [Bryobacteraceae bacterium]|nr:hypothetical protein [Bryobacteraceae bacterium]
MNTPTTPTPEQPYRISAYELELGASKRRTPHNFINHTAYVTSTWPKFYNFTELSRSGEVRRFLALGDAEVTLALNGVADDDSDATPVTMPVMSRAVVLVEEFHESDPYPYTWYFVSIPRNDEYVEIGGDDSEAG